MDKLDKILGQSLAKRGLVKATGAALICFYATEWGKGIFEPISYLNGTLKVSVSSSPAAAELQMRECELIDFLNQKLGRAAVRQVRIIVNSKGIRDKG